MIKLLLPVRDILVTQLFGMNYLDFYKQWGLKGHNGIDFYAKAGCKVNAAHTGIVTTSGFESGGGNTVEIASALTGEGFKTVYCHLKEIYVKQGEEVPQGKVIGLADNTGIYTTGDHLHFGLKEIKDGATINKDNGYNGAINPAPYFQAGKDWDKSAAYNRYGRKQEWRAEFNMRFKNLWLHKQLYKYHQINKIYDTEFINALVYGGWGFEDVINAAMRENWGWLTKTEYRGGKRSFT